MPNERKKRKVSRISGVFDAPNYRGIEANAELTEKIRQVIRK